MMMGRVLLKNVRILRIIRIRQDRPPPPYRACQSYYYSTTTTIKSSSSSSSSYRHVPKPTWSIRDLKLTETHPPLPKEELQRLGRRAALTIDENDSQQLQQDLANMMQMVQQVSHVSKTLQLEFENDDGDDDNDGDIYDAVRGVTKAPLRTSPSSSEKNAAQAQQVWESYLQPRTKRSRGGGHDYFVITTKTSSSTSKED
jgi:hypothetical protein